MPGAGQHRDHGLGDHRQVDRDPVALLDAELGQRVRGLADLVLELGVGDVAGVVLGLADPVQGDLVAVAGLDVPVDAVVRRVDGAADEPLRERRVVPVEDPVPLLAPVEALGLLGPERLAVGGGPLVGLLLDVGVRPRARPGARSGAPRGRGWTGSRRSSRGSSGCGVRRAVVLARTYRPGRRPDDPPAEGRPDGRGGAFGQCEDRRLRPGAGEGADLELGVGGLGLGLREVTVPSQPKRKPAGIEMMPGLASGNHDQSRAGEQRGLRAGHHRREEPRAPRR